MEDISIKDYKYKVATRCFTYNHAPYITDALRGFAMQEISFPSVYIIVDDASTDGEPEVIREWARGNLEYEECKKLWKEMPYGQLAVAPLKDKPLSTFVILLLSENHYQTGKSLKRFDYISEWLNKSNYQAMCEGDDYWIYEKKLQEQVDYLDANTACALVHTKASVYDDSLKKLNNQIKGNYYSSFEDLLLSNKVVSLTVCVRNSAYFNYLNLSTNWEEKKEWKMGDYPCWLWLTKHYDVHFIDKVTGVYRMLPESASHSPKINKILDFYKSNYQIQTFFAKMFSVDEDYKKMLNDNYVKDKIRVLCRFGQYRDALVETKLLEGVERLKSVLFIIVKSIKKK